MKTFLRSLCVVMVCACLSGCEDNGVHLAYALKKGAKKLRDSTETELVIEYKPLTGIHQKYDVIFQASIYPVLTNHPGSSDPWWSYGSGAVGVGGKRGGSSTYHQMFVHVNKDFSLMKTNEATFITLRKSGDRIDVVDVR